jgi:hypothetical protein
MRRIPLCLIAFALACSAPVAAQDSGASDEYPLIEGCKWKDQTVLINGKSNQKLSFRYQDCDGTNAAKVTFTLDKGNALLQTWADGASDTVAQLWALNGGKRSELVAALASPSIADNEKGRCIVRLDYVTGQYSYEPNAGYLEELLAKDEPFSACGEYGATNDSVQFFAVIDNALLVFFWVGQDTPLFDPNSFHYENSEKPGAVE